MSNRFPAPCPVSKQIIGSKNWCGYSPFAFPGFVGTWNVGASSGFSTPGGWTEGWVGGAPGVINVGDLVLSSIFPDAAFSGSPQVYFVYQCTLAGATAGGRSVDPAMDSTSNAFPFDAVDSITGQSQANQIPTGNASPTNYPVYPASIPSGGTGTYIFTAVVGQTYNYTLGGAGTGDWGGDAGIQAISVAGLTAASGTFVATSTSIAIVGQNTTGFTMPAGSGSMNAQLSIPRHFAPWSGYGSRGLDGPTITPDSTISPFGGRVMWMDGSAGGVAYLNLSITTEYDNWPSATGLSPSTLDYLSLTDGTFAYTWAVNEYNGAVTTTTPGTAPDSHQTSYLFPVVPPAWYNRGDGVWHVGPFLVNPSFGGYPFSATCPLVSWNFTATELQFVWAAWLSGANIGQAGSTITQTVALSTEYDLSTSQSQALALLSGTTFGALNWNQKATCSYNSDGTIAVAISAISSTTAEDTTCSGGAMAGPTATAATGYAETAASSDGWDWTYSKALVDVCGNYCLRTFYCNRSPAVVDCASGTVDGYAPVEMDPPSFNASLGDEAVYTFCYPKCQCT